jgi:tRNA threonylcarbamoyladenosine biosynthesis protein TsaB
MHSPGKATGGASAETVRPMTALDISAALSVLEESPEAATWSRDSLLDAASRGMAWTAEVEGLVAGILIGQAAADEFEILNLAVANVHRGHGVATRLVGAALDSARAAGAAKTYLEVRSSNERAIALYSKLGVHISGRRPRYYRDPEEDAILLVLDTIGTAR